RTGGVAGGGKREEVLKPGTVHRGSSGAWNERKRTWGRPHVRGDHGGMKIIDIREKTCPIASPIRNAYIDFSKMTLSLVAVVTDVVRAGRRVVGYGFNSNGRYGQANLMRERFIPRIMEAAPESLVDETGENLDPH